MENRESRKRGQNKQAAGAPHALPLLLKNSCVCGMAGAGSAYNIIKCAWRKTCAYIREASYEHKKRLLCAVDFAFMFNGDALFSLIFA